MLRESFRQLTYPQRPCFLDLREHAVCGCRPASLGSWSMPSCHLSCTQAFRIDDGRPPAQHRFPSISVGVRRIVISGPPADSGARRSASLVAGLLATLAVVGASLALILSPSPQVRDSAVTITDTSEKVEAGASPRLTTTHTEEHSTPATDTSALGRLFAAPGSQLLLSVGFVLLAAFLVGAFAQRVLLGEYALSVGPDRDPGARSDHRRRNNFGSGEDYAVGDPASSDS